MKNKFIQYFKIFVNFIVKKAKQFYSYLIGDTGITPDKLTVSYISIKYGKMFGFLGLLLTIFCAIFNWFYYRNFGLDYFYHYPLTDIFRTPTFLLFISYPIFDLGLKLLMLIIYLTIYLDIANYFNYIGRKKSHSEKDNNINPVFINRFRLGAMILLPIGFVVWFICIPILKLGTNPKTMIKIFLVIMVVMAFAFFGIKQKNPIVALLFILLTPTIARFSANHYAKLVKKEKSQYRVYLKGNDELFLNELNTKEDSINFKHKYLIGNNISHYFIYDDCNNILRRVKKSMIIDIREKNKRIDSIQ